MNRLYVNIYSVGQAYGGPEEGDWWFSTGTPVGAIPVELTEEEWLKMREEAVLLGILSEDYGPAPLDRENHEHGDWCRPDEHDIAYVGEDVPPFSVRCYEAAWRDHIRQTLREKADIVRTIYDKRYPVTGKQYSVLGGEDYEVVIEDHFARPYPDHKPHYE